LTYRSRRAGNPFCKRIYAHRRFYYLNYSFLCSFSWFLSSEKRKGTKRKKTVGVNFLPYTVLMPPKSTGGIFLNFVKRNLKTVGFVLVRFAEILSLSYPLTRPSITVGFLKTPKGDFQTAG